MTKLKRIVDSSLRISDTSLKMTFSQNWHSWIKISLDNLREGPFEGRINYYHINLHLCQCSQRLCIKFPLKIFKRGHSVPPIPSWDVPELTKPQLKLKIPSDTSPRLLDFKLQSRAVKSDLGLKKQITENSWNTSTFQLFSVSFSYFLWFADRRETFPMWTSSLMYCFHVA